MLDPKEIGLKYPAIDMLFSPETYGHSVFQFFRDILDKCNHVTTLHVHNGQFVNTFLEAVDYFFGLMAKGFIERVTKIIIGRATFEMKDINSYSLILSIDAHSNDLSTIMNLLLQKYNLSHRNPQLYMYIIMRGVCDMTTLFSKYSKELHIVGDHKFLPL